MREATKLELHQISIDAARAVLHERNLGQMVEHATRRAVGARFADPVVAASALEPLLPEIRQVASSTAADAATDTAGAMVDVVREDIELARADVVRLAHDATARADAALAQARAEVEALARDAGEKAEVALAQARGRVTDLAAASEKTVNTARQEVAELATTATGTAQRAVDEARQEVRAFVAAATEKANAALDAARTEVVELAREAAEKAAAEYVPRPVEVRLPNGEHNRVTGYTHEVLPELLLALGARCHVLLVGPAGTGKSMLATHAAEALGLPLQAISLGPTTPMSKVFGYYDAHGNYHDTPFRRAFEHGGVMLLDELDNGHPGLLAELNQALALGVCAFADGMVSAHPDFRLVATGNTYGSGGDRRYVGRQALDAATLDRFVTMEVPVDEQLEERVALGLAPAKKRLVRQLLTEVRRLREVATDKQLPVMFSPRVSYDGARLLAAGATYDQVVSWRVIRGLSDAHRSALGLTS
ncbi:AAA family ATPase [Actinophytocola sp. NPDC049390]|uniref:AAA family ATPase n=1 Tax=Actinophytocola sp. NPDC049390 TaxID=3363894 RepID=UPI00378C6966